MTSRVRATALGLILACAAGAAIALAGGGDGADPRRATARPDTSDPVTVALKPAHRSGVSGTARLVTGRSGLLVTLELSERVPGRLLAHIHSGPCSDEPTWSNPRIRASLSEVVRGRSRTKVEVVALSELRSDGASINVHDPENGLRPLVCGDIPGRD